MTSGKSIKAKRMKNIKRAVQIFIVLLIVAAMLAGVIAEIFSGGQSAPSVT